MDPPPFRFPGTPGTPLYPLSPERVNTRSDRTSTVFGHAHLPQSPSLPEFSSFAKSPYHSRTGSDVQHIVARFDSLSVRDRDEDERKIFELDKKKFEEERKRGDAKLKRAEMGREEAEGEVRRLREEVKRLKQGVEKEDEQREEEVKTLREEIGRINVERDEQQEREIKDKERLEVLTEAMKRAQKAHAEAERQYSKESRRNKKEALMSQSALVKCQEELKATRNTLRLAQQGWDLEKHKVSKREQEAFAAQYQLVGVQEELTRMKERLNIVEEERVALKASLKQEEVARIAAEGRIALPPAQEEDNEFASPKKRKVESPAMDKENIEPLGGTMWVNALREELEWEQQRRAKAEDHIQFMKMECQFGCCSCRVAERRGLRYMHDKFWMDAAAPKRASVTEFQIPMASIFAEEPQHIHAATEMNIVLQERPLTPPEEVSTDMAIIDSHVTFSPTSGTFRALSSPTRTEITVVQEARPQTPDEIMLDKAPSKEEATNSITYAHTDIVTLVERTSKDLPVQRTPSVSKSPFTHTQHPPSSKPPSPPLAAPPKTPSHSHDPQNYLCIPRPISFREITTTTKIPLAPAPSTPHLPISREEALAQLAQRRGRARSIAHGNLTPRKQMLEGVMEKRRDCSAPTIGAVGSRSVSRGRREAR